MRHSNTFLGALSCALMFAAGSAAQTPTASSASPVTYVDGQLKIEATDAVLPDILRQIGHLLGVSIDVPAEMTREPIPVMKYGPAPAQDVIADLLRASRWNFAIQDAGPETGKIQSVLLLGPSKLAKEPEPAVRASRSPFLRPPEPDPESADPETLAQPEPVPTQSSSASDSGPPDPPTPSSSPVGAPAQPAFDPNATRPGALSPPASLDSKSITSQLKQMYQQRVAMNTQPGATIPASH